MSVTELHVCSIVVIVVIVVIVGIVDIVDIVVIAGIVAVAVSLRVWPSFMGGVCMYGSVNVSFVCDQCA